MLTTDNTKHLFNLSMYRTVSEKNILSNFPYNVDVNEYESIYNNKSRSRSECRVGVMVARNLQTEWL